MSCLGGEGCTAFYLKVEGAGRGQARAWAAAAGPLPPSRCTPGAHRSILLHDALGRAVVYALRVHPSHAPLSACPMPAAMEAALLHNIELEVRLTWRPLLPVILADHTLRALCASCTHLSPAPARLQSGGAHGLDGSGPLHHSPSAFAMGVCAGARGTRAGHHQWWAAVHVLSLLQAHAAYPPRGMPALAGPASEDAYVKKVRVLGLE